MKAHLVGSRRIWNASPHNAFTSLTRFGDCWYCAFRTASTHMSEDGRIAIIRSRDGQEWEEAACLDSPVQELPDLRDPKLLATAGGSLLLMAGATTRSAVPPRQSYRWSSTDGSQWGAPRPAGKHGLWLWSLADGRDALYSAAYVKGGEGELSGDAEISLYRQDQEREGFSHHATIYRDAQFPNETALLFSGDKGYAVIRREMARGQTSMPPHNNGTALFATSRSPFTEWSATDLGLYLGGPAMIQLPGGEIIVSARTITSGHYTGLWALDPTSRSLKELLLLPSGNDCAYPGLVWHDERLWVSYYSAHERQCCIYLAEVQLA